MRIVILIDKLTDGGAERQAVVLANLLSQKGQDVSVVTYSPAPDFYKVSAAVKRVRLGDTSSSLIRFLNIFRFFTFTRYDAVICFMIGNTKHVINSTLLRNRRSFRIISCERNTTTRTNWDAEKLMMEKYYRYSNSIVANSHTQGENLKQMFPTWLDKIHVITNYTDINRIPVSALPLKEVIEIGIFARYAEQKNGFAFCEMLAEIKGKTDRRFHVSWYGNQYLSQKGIADKNYLRMMRFIEENNLKDYISLNSTTDVASVIDTIDIICLPSLWEGFSNSVAEGICYGKPMLVSNVSDNSLMVHEGVNGKLFDPTDKLDMMNALLYMLSKTGEQLKEMGTNSRRIAERLFDADRFVDQYLLLCQ